MDINVLRKEAINNKIPIMQDEGIEYLLEFIKDKGIKNILEIGTAVGYSAIRMANLDKNIKITTIERDEERYNEAVKNVDSSGLSSQITLIFDDALNVNLDGVFDLIFIDAAKGKNIEFFERFKKNLSETGYIITDNLKFHGYVDMDLESIESRNIRGLVKKIRKYVIFLEDNPEFETTFLSLGDGISISKKTVK